MPDYRQIQKGQLTQPPEGPVRDTAMALIGCLPFGSVFQLVAGQFWEDPTQRRIQTLLVQLAQDVNDLAERSEDAVGDLLQREEVQPVLAQAIDTAAKTLGQQKLEAIRNAAFKGMTDLSADFDTTSMIFVLLNQLSNGHFRYIRAIVEKNHPAINGVPAGDLTTLGITYAATPDGFQDPAQSAINNLFYDLAVVERNQLAITDLVTVGVIEKRLKTPKSFIDFNEDPSKNLPLSYHLTSRGLDLYEYVFPPTSLGEWQSFTAAGESS
ncbi:hypothetical protein [Pararhizobium sp.]|uniref:hypothetical protein n=1 Tax=Pararhizobium sp. TaxID=1977563 RepID=UPI00271A5C52|nr:hypothetical protein [Pararhizobium sp.]MDO9417969.1 hypothetical protein [Pararhizobium sp.]